jgi:23S rRNA (cytidine1920-2'-O)/16S rRNA (cytidine1409-2'-O)-methyltransferase
MPRCRIDKLVVDRGLVTTREKARRLIFAGELLVDDKPIDKPGTMVRDESTLRLRHPPKPFVGRGGEKLEGALKSFSLDVAGLRALDVGASTGGFTDCLLQHGVSDITALDVGKGQLDWKLYTDRRVRVMDNVNARHLIPSDFPEPFDLVTADVAFISLSKIVPALAKLLRAGAPMLMLVKPQFELGPDAVKRGGLVRDPREHFRAIETVLTAVREAGLSVLGVVPAVITGATGNQEFFLLAQASNGGKTPLSEKDFRRQALKACGLEAT